MTRMFYMTIIFATLQAPRLHRPSRANYGEDGSFGVNFPPRQLLRWGETEARAIIGTEIEYSANSFRWKDKTAKHPTAGVSVVTAKQFHDENSGGGANSSQVSFGQLGIKAATAKQVTINHPGTTSELPGEPSEIPGHIVLLKNQNTIVFSVCNVYFEAKRVVASSPSNGNAP